MDIFELPIQDLRGGTAIRSLNLANCQLSLLDIAVVAEMLRANIMTRHIGKTPHLAATTHCAHQETLLMRFCFLATLATGLRNNAGLTPSSVTYLSEALQYNDTLQTISFHAQKLPAVTLLGNDTLTSLDISNAYLSEHDVVFIAHTVKHNGTLKHMRYPQPPQHL